MTHEDAFIADIIANPADDAVRLIYADWLDGQGREEYGEFIRVQCELANCSLDEDSAKRMALFSYNPNSVRHALEIAKKRRRERELLDPMREGYPKQGKGERADWAGEPLRRLRHRPEHIDWEWSRGFIAEVRLSCQDWLAHGPALVRRQPIERVVLVGKTPGRMWGHDTGNESNYRRWWNILHSDGNSQMDPDVLPGCLFDCIVFPFESGYHFPTEALALAALSAAALLWARQTEPATSV